MINQNILSRRAAEIIMVLKGQHNLFEDIPAMESKREYIDVLAAYMSDDCHFPFKTYVDYPVLIEEVIQTVVKEYFEVCSNPSAFLAQYFSAHKEHRTTYNDTQCWCAALALQPTQNKEGEYINGFNKYNAVPYARKHEFFA